MRQISVKELARQLANGRLFFLVDVRQPWEHELAALPDSVLIPLAELPRRLQEIRPSVDATLVAYCHHGIRSLSAAAFLEQAGFANVVSLAGGIDAWSLHVDPSVPRY
jgi:adenylyltransferase/sulfurtransferase